MSSIFPQTAVSMILNQCKRHWERAALLMRDGRTRIKYEELTLSHKSYQISVCIMKSEYFNILNKAFKKWRFNKDFIVSSLSFTKILYFERKYNWSTSDYFLKGINLKHYSFSFFLEYVNLTNGKWGCKNKLISACIKLHSFPDFWTRVRI